MTFRIRLLLPATIVFLVVTTAVAYHIYSRRQIIVCGDTRVGADLSVIAVALREFRRVSGRLPTDAEGLGALVQRPGDVEPWMQLFRELPADPWSRPYQYRVSSQRPDGFDVLTLGPDPMKNSDDIHFPAR